MKKLMLCFASLGALMAPVSYAQYTSGFRGWLFGGNFGYERDGKPVVPEGAYAVIYSAKPLWMGFVWKTKPPVRKFTGDQYIAFMRFMTAAKEGSEALSDDAFVAKNRVVVGVLEVGATNVESQSFDITCTPDKKWYVIVFRNDPISSSLIPINDADSEVAKWLAVPSGGR